MKARVLTTASLIGAFAGALPAADPELMRLVMPDVKVMSGVNVVQARLSPFGQFVLTQMENARVQQLTAATGFDPQKDLTELLVVSNGAPGLANSLALASGAFQTDKLGAIAAVAGAEQENYKSVWIIENTAKTEGVAFVNGTILIAGSVANVKGAIDRQTAPAVLPAALVAQANELSAAYDAWAISTVSPASLVPADGKAQAVGGMKIPLNALQQVQGGYLAVKFGANVALAAQAQTDTPENANGLAGLLQLVGNFAQMQAAQNPDAAAFAKTLKVTANGSAVNISADLPEAQFQKFLTPKHTAKANVQGDKH